MAESDWTTIVGVVAAIAAIGAARLCRQDRPSLHYARSGADRINLLEQRLAQPKYDDYKVPIEAMGHALSGHKVPEAELVESVRAFG